jgi:hypothetical protein
MKTLLSSAALAALVALPAHAQSARTTTTVAATSVAAQLAPYPRDVVIREGKYIGQDPDPNVRLDLLRDYAPMNQ